MAAPRIIIDTIVSTIAQSTGQEEFIGAISDADMNAILYAILIDEKFFEFVRTNISGLNNIVAERISNNIYHLEDILDAVEAPPKSADDIESKVKDIFKHTTSSADEILDRKDTEFILNFIHMDEKSFKDIYPTQASIPAHADSGDVGESIWVKTSSEFDSHPPHDGSGGGGGGGGGGVGTGVGAGPGTPQSSSDPALSPRSSSTSPSPRQRARRASLPARRTPKPPPPPTAPGADFGGFGFLEVDAAPPGLTKDVAAEEVLKSVSAVPSIDVLREQARNTSKLAELRVALAAADKAGLPFRKESIVKEISELMSKSFGQVILMNQCPLVSFVDEKGAVGTNKDDVGGMVPGAVNLEFKSDEELQAAGFLNKDEALPAACRTHSSVGVYAFDPDSSGMYGSVKRCYPKTCGLDRILVNDPKKATRTTNLLKKLQEVITAKIRTDIGNQPMSSIVDSSVTTATLAYFDKADSETKNEIITRMTRDLASMYRAVPSRPQPVDLRAEAEKFIACASGFIKNKNEGTLGGAKRCTDVVDGTVAGSKACVFVRSATSGDGLCIPQEGKDIISKDTVGKEREGVRKRVGDILRTVETSARQVAKMDETGVDAATGFATGGGRRHLEGLARTMSNDLAGRRRI